MTNAQSSQLDQARKYQKTVIRNIRDKIWLFSKNINTHLLFKKLDYKMISLFEVMRGKKFH